MSDAAKRLFVGRPLRSDRLGETLLPKKLALPVFCSDPLSSVAYATENILVVLALGGLSYLHLTPYLGLVVVVLLAVVVASYRQTVRAYPGGGGDYVVANDNISPSAGLTAASALLVDYVLTVAVSVAAGVAAITSAFPGLAGDKVPLSAGFILILTLVNLRGVKESGKGFAVPTYGFVLVVYALFAVAVVKLLGGADLHASSAALPLPPQEHTGGLLTVFLLLRAFASGCTALTGVEAVSTGVPVFKPDKSKNAATTLVIMGVFSITMFIGITVLALVTHVHMLPQATAVQPTALSQIGAAIFGGKAVMFYVLQAFTAGILVLAANTAFNGFPVLASILSQDRYLPRQLSNRGDRLVYSNGVLLLAGFALLLIVAFKADVTRIIQLYIIGVFVAFTLGQTGMVRRWQRMLRTERDAGERGRIRRRQSINLTGAVSTGAVLVIVLLTKFVAGAWIVCIAMPVIFLLMRGIRRHYDAVSRELEVEVVRAVLPARNHAFVLVSKIHAPTLRALAFGKSIHPFSLEALTVSVDKDETKALSQAWDASAIDVPLKIIDSPYRDITSPVVQFVREYAAKERDLITVIIPEYVVGHWWENLLHNQSALRIKGRLLFVPGVTVISVPWQLKSSGAALTPEQLAKLRAARELDAQEAAAGAAAKGGVVSDSAVSGVGSAPAGTRAGLPRP